MDQGRVSLRILLPQKF